LKKKTGLLLFLSLFNLSSSQELQIQTSYKTTSSESQNTSVVKVITESEINEKHPYSITEMLNQIPEISLTSNGGFGQPTSVYLRGFDPKRTLVLINGIRVNDVTGLNGAQFELLTVDDVKQIEIIEGPQSGIWGADASAGVINIITKKPEKGFHAKTVLEYGSFNTKKAGTMVSYKNSIFYILSDYYILDTDGFSAAEPRKGSLYYGKRGDELGWEKDGYKNQTYTLETGLFLTDKDTLSFFFKGIDANVHYDAAAGVDAKDYDNPFGFGLTEYFNKIHNKFYSLSFNHKDKKNDFKIYYNYSIFKRSQYGGYTGDVGELGVQNRYNYLENSFFILGFVNQNFKQNKSAGIELNKSYIDKGYFITNVNNFKNFVLTESLRYDNYNKFENKLTGKLGAKYFIKKDVYISSNYGTAYNVPTIYQLYDSWVGNQNLKPEDVKGYDISGNLKGFSVTYFYNKIKNLIDFDFNTFKYKNIEGTSKIKGVEISYKKFFEPLKINFYIGYAYLDAKDANGKKLPRRPKDKINFEIGYYPDTKINAVLYGEYIGNRKDTDNVQTGYYTVLNGVINYKITKYVKFYFKIDNITNKYYQTVNGYATAKRSFYGGFLAQF
jgi:vitamin B12 transporter